MEKNGVHTLAGVTSHGLSEIPEIKVSVKEKLFMLPKQCTYQRIFLMCSLASHTSCPGSTPLSSPTEGSPPVTTLLLLCLFKVTTSLARENWSKNRSLCKIKFTRKWWTVSWKALGINSDRWMGRRCNFLSRNVWL